MLRLETTIVIILAIVTNVWSQGTTPVDPLEWQLDFRFRLEQDWNSRKSDGTYRDDRSRLRYRLRFGASYERDWYQFGARLRTGDQRKQQDPQITLGKGLKEFGTVPVGFEKLYFQANQNGFKGWVGKNTYPFTKNNELFWSDNVFPEGVFIEKEVKSNSTFFSSLAGKLGHFILESNDGSFANDAFFSGMQMHWKNSTKRVELYPSIYLFRNIDNIPDGAATSTINYSFFHLGSRLNLGKENSFVLEFDYYLNFENYEDDPDISTELKEQKTGFAAAAKYGSLAEKGSWFFALTYTYLERFANVDFMAQNDWARWDYSNFDSPDGRLSNMHGIEAVAAYAINPKTNLVMKLYLVEQLVPYGVAKENGTRIRFDLNTKI